MPYPDETPSEFADRVMQDTGEKIFKSHKGPESAAQMVAWAAIAAGDQELATQFFKQALSLTVPQKRETELQRWGGWAIRAESPDAVRALAELGLDWSEAQALGVDGRPLPVTLNSGKTLRVPCFLVDQALRAESDIALGVLRELGAINPRKIPDPSHFLSEWRTEMSRLAWAARDPRAFGRLIDDPAHRGDQDSLDEALWALAQSTAIARDGPVLAQLLDLGANPFRAWPTGSRGAKITHPGRSGVERREFMMDPIVASKRWLDRADKDGARDRKGGRMSIREIEKEFARRERQALDTLKLPNKEDGAPHTREEYREALFEVNGFDKALADLRTPAGWGPLVAEANWDCSRDLIAHFVELESEGSSGGIDLTEKMDAFWNAVASRVDWKNMPAHVDGAGPLAFLMRQKSFGGRIPQTDAAQSEKQWAGRRCMQTLLDAGCALRAEHPENDPLELALQGCVEGAGRKKALSLLIEREKNNPTGITFHEKTMGRATRALMAQMAQALQSPVQGFGVEKMNGGAPKTIQPLLGAVIFAPNAAQSKAWTTLVLATEEAMVAFSGQARWTAPSDNERARATLERLELIAVEMENALSTDSSAATPSEALKGKTEPDASASALIPKVRRI